MKKKKKRIIDKILWPVAKNRLQATNMLNCQSLSRGISNTSVRVNKTAFQRQIVNRVLIILLDYKV